MVPDHEPHRTTLPILVHHYYHTPCTTCVIAFIASPTLVYIVLPLNYLAGSASAGIKTTPLPHTSLNATGLVGRLTRLGYLGSLPGLVSTHPLCCFRSNHRQQYGYRRRKQTFGAPPEGETSTSLHRPNQWSPFSPVLTFALHEYQETAFRVRFQATSSGSHTQWCQWQCQWNGITFKQSEERATEAWRCPSKSDWKGNRRAETSKNDARAICQDTAVHLEEVSEQTAISNNTPTPYALPV